jgi:hypothetical protein
VLLTYVVTSAASPTWTVVDEVKPVPLTVNVSGPEPATAVVGLIEVTVGAVTETGSELPELDVVPEFDEDPPQPASRTDATRHKVAANPARFFMRNLV